MKNYLFINSLKIILFFFFNRTDDLKLGTHVGTDKYGNRYFQNNFYFYGKYLYVNLQWSNVKFNLQLFISNYCILFIRS